MDAREIIYYSVFLALIVDIRQAFKMQALRQFGEKLNTAIPTVQSKVELERSNIDSTDGLVASQPRSGSGFSVKNILAVEDLDSALPSIP